MTDDDMRHAPGRLSHDRYCDEIIAQTDLLRSHLTGADLGMAVPTCPDWTLRDLAAHVGGAHRWVETIVRTRATERVSLREILSAVEPVRDGDPAALDAWLAEGARLLVDVLREAGPGLACWSWGWESHSGFWARRMTHETLIHRADAALTVGAAYEAAPEVAADALDEWLRIVRFFQDAGIKEDIAQLKAGGRTLHLHATDTAPEIAAEWLIELGDDGIAWSRAHEKADAALRGPLTDVLLTLLRREPLTDGGRVEVLGDRELIDFWLERSAFA
ncbi:maleylpyruvate isomerase family mycothiol-dependent enzyme [Streptomyces beihaiensis]|uniref:Maleylpyruvate isomerase family mycothiol-dependent enzyme n=1 Tax=Streptomyces beihaiensis TaxID=2984495 RepID=A0ABT3TPD2_9ACTN|nr:maleylpyruvate isomerase family mycothiol-dependent enzyme [Streptomyces beihaiensis]MCX3058866.1 maleylpyruvate isomerase family mycothiol-dependent enzyme [Streptomyces beihaiensis]